MKFKIGCFEFEFKRYQKEAYFARATTLLGHSENFIDLRALSFREYEYVIERFGDTLKSLVYINIEQRIRAGLSHYGVIKGEESISIEHSWSIKGNDLLVWLGEYRRKHSENKDIEKIVQ